MHTLQWALGATSDIYIVFAKDPQSAARLMQRFKQLAHSFGATPAEIRREIVLQGNVVFYANTFTGLTSRRASLIKAAFADSACYWLTRRLARIACSTC